MTRSSNPQGPGAGELARSSEWLRRLALRLARDEASADDLLQETWLAMRRAGTTRLDAAAGFLRNIARRQRRGESRRSLHEGRAARREALPSAAELASALEAQRALVEELEGLPASSRELLLLRMHRGLSAAAIARSRGVPASTVRDQLGKAERMLRDRLDRRYGGGEAQWAPAFLILGRGLPPLGFFATTLGGITAVKLATQTAAVVLVLALLGSFFFRPGSGKPVPELAGSGPQGEVIQAVDPEPATAGTPQSEGDRVAVPKGSQTVGPRELFVVDRRTQLPAPWYAVELEAEGEVIATAMTDGTGRAELPSELLSPDAILRAVDHPEFALRNPDELRLDAEMLSAEGALRFEIALGPTYLLQLPEAPPAEVGAFLSTRAFDDDALNDRLFNPGSPLREPAGEGESLPWVRLDPEASTELPQSADIYLRLRHRLGHYHASGRVDSTRWEGPELITLEAVNGAQIESRVTVEGEVPTTNVQVTLQRRGEWLPDSRSVRTFFVGAEGMWRPGVLSLAFLDPGEWSLNLSGEGLVERTLELELEPGATYTQPFDLERVAGRSPLDVFVDSQSGEAPLRTIGVRAVKGDLSVEATPLYDSEEAELHLRFEGLEPGTWRIEPVRTVHLPDFEPASLEVAASAGVGQVEFTCMDAGIDWRPTEIELVDARTGERVETAAVHLWVDGEPFLGSGLSRGHGALEPIRPGARIDVAAHARGYSAILQEGLRLPAEGPLRLEMWPGWGVVVVARELGAPGAPTLEGVQIKIDGRDAGRTDALGRLLLEAPEMPGEIRCELEGWNHVLGDVDPESGRITSPDNLWTTKLWFQRK